MCGQLREMREGKAGGVREPLDRQGVVARVLGKVRLYLCPFAVCHGETQGRGFVFVQVKEATYCFGTGTRYHTLHEGVLLGVDDGSVTSIHDCTALPYSLAHCRSLRLREFTEDLGKSFISTTISRPSSEWARHASAQKLCM